MSGNTMNILIGGEAGQGLLTVGQTLVKSIMRSGYSILVTQNSQSRIRGGHNTFAIRMGLKDVVAPTESVDVLVALNEETVKIHRDEMSSRGCIIADETFKILEIGKTIPMVLCFQIEQLWPKSERQLEEVILASPLRVCKGRSTRVPSSIRTVVWG